MTTPTRLLSPAARPPSRRWLLEWLVAGVAVVAGAVLFLAGSRPLVPSEFTEERLVVPASGAPGSECAWHFAMEEYLCGFRLPAAQPGWRTPPSDAQRLLVAKTTDGRTILVGGLGAQPAVAALRPGREAVVSCQLHILGRMEGFKVRDPVTLTWSTTPSPKTWVAQAVSCRGE